MRLSKTCPFCNNNKIVESTQLPIYFNSKIFTWNKCENCRLLFLLPHLNDSDKEAMYKSSYHQTYYFNYTEDYSKQLEIIKPFQKKTFLDYGCGDAGLISFLQKNNYIVTGVEYDKNLVEILTSKFQEINFIKESRFWETFGTFDIIHLGDVLEHVSNPADLMYKLKKYLNPGGIFFIEGPLECNPCLGYYFRKCTYFIRNIISKESTRVKFPYHITYSNATNQQLFFNELQLKKILFKVGEAGWPYIDKLAEVKSPWLLLQYLVSKISIFFSSFIPGWGNRFTYIGKQK